MCHVPGASSIIRPFANHRADFLGHFAITDLEPGTYRLGAADALPNNVNLALLDVSALTAVSVQEGSEVRNVDLSSGTVPEFSLTGRVVDAVGQIPRSMQIEYGVPGATHRGLLSVVTPDGRFQIRDRQITAGPLTVLARGEDDNGPVIGLVTVTVIDGPNELEVIVGKPGGLRGRVTIEGGIAVAAARLALVRDGFMPLGAADDVIEVAPDGWVEATGLIGEYRVRVDEPQRWTVKAVRRRGVRTLNDRLTIRNTETLDDLEIVIGPR